MNPFSTLKKLIKSKPVIDELEKDVKNMGAKNWKTTTCGILALLLELGTIWAPVSYQPKIHLTVIAFVTAGLIKAKDKDVTGGSRPQ